MKERKLIIGLITNTDLLNGIKDIWKAKYMSSDSASKIATWCWSYFEQYKQAPKESIEDIFYEQVKLGKVSKDLAEEIEEDIFPSLSKEYQKKNQDTELLIKKAKKYFRKRNLELLKDHLDDLITKGDIDTGEKIINQFETLIDEESQIDFSDKSILNKIENAFDNKAQNLIHYPYQLGQLLNEHLVKGGFVAFLAPEKRGKTFMLLDMAMRALRQKRTVAFFQAGDMTDYQQLIRIAIYLSKVSNKDKYCKEHWELVKDCVFNQDNSCDSPNRECDFGILENANYTYIREEVTKSELIELYNQFEDYKPCHNCKRYYQNKIGANWIKKIPASTPLDVNTAKLKIENFFLKGHKQFKLSTHPNSTLSVDKAKNELKKWKKEGFIPDVILFDYADIMYGIGKDEREKQNNIWKALRALSQDPTLPLVVTVTQSDANSYEKDTLQMKNFSEDKRKYAHVTAMWGLNQDSKGREKELGLIRINELIIREGENIGKDVKVIGNLRKGRPIISSYW